jgi:hypothetical protein
LQATTFLVLREALPSDRGGRYGHGPAWPCLHLLAGP